MLDNLVTAVVFVGVILGTAVVYVYGPFVARAVYSALTRGVEQ